MNRQEHSELDASMEKLRHALEEYTKATGRVLSAEDAEELMICAYRSVMAENEQKFIKTIRRVRREKENKEYNTDEIIRKLDIHTKYLSDLINKEKEENK
jgi:hypothetical protein